MSYFKNDRLFQLESGSAEGCPITESISSALRREYREVHSAVKVIGRETGVNPRAIRNWYEGVNAPNCGHLVALARHTPVIVEAFLGLVGYGEIWELYQEQTTLQDNSMRKGKAGSSGTKYSDKDVTIDITINRKTASRLNQRQLWFLGRLQRGDAPNADAIARTWGVTLRTARRDVAALGGMDLISFVGAKKTGCYILKAA